MHVTKGDLPAEYYKTWKLCSLHWNSSVPFIHIMCLPLLHACLRKCVCKYKRALKDPMGAIRSMNLILYSLVKILEAP